MRLVLSIVVASILFVVGAVLLTIRLVKPRNEHVSRKQSKKLKKILAADLDGKSEEGIRLLHWAATHDEPETITALLEKEADINAPDPEGLTALHKAVMMGETEMVEFLLTSGADVNVQSVGGRTPLHKAVDEDKVEIAKMLLKKGASVDAKNAHGRTALHKAAYLGNMEAVTLLLRYGANPRAKGELDETPEVLAKSQHHHEIADLLKKKSKSRSKRGE